MKTDNFAESSGVSKRLYTGLAEFEPIAINPKTSDEIKKILSLPKDLEVKEPNYKLENGGYRIDIYFKKVKPQPDFEKTEDVIVKGSFFVKNSPKITEAGKALFINDNGKTRYFDKDRVKSEIKEYNESLMENESWKSFNPSGVVLAFEGEDKLIDFIVALFRLNQNKSTIKFDNRKDIANGKVGELELLLQEAKDKNKTLFLLCGVKEGKFQSVYTKAFLPYGYSSKQLASFMKKAEDLKYGFKTEFTEKWQEYIPSEAPLSSEVYADAKVGEFDVNGDPSDNPFMDTFEGESEDISGVSMF